MFEIIKRAMPILSVFILIVLVGQSSLSCASDENISYDSVCKAILEKGTTGGSVLQYCQAAKADFAAAQKHEVLRNLWSAGTVVCAAACAAGIFKYAGPEYACSATMLGIGVAEFALLQEFTTFLMALAGAALPLMTRAMGSGGASADAPNAKTSNLGMLEQVKEKFKDAAKSLTTRAARSYDSCAQAALTATMIAMHEMSRKSSTKEGQEELNKAYSYLKASNAVGGSQPGNSSGSGVALDAGKNSVGLSSKAISPSTGSTSVQVDGSANPIDCAAGGSSSERLSCAVVGDSAAKSLIDDKNFQKTFADLTHKNLADVVAGTPGRPLGGVLGDILGDPVAGKQVASAIDSMADSMLQSKGGAYYAGGGGNKEAMGGGVLNFDALLAKFALPSKDPHAEPVLSQELSFLLRQHYASDPQKIDAFYAKISLFARVSQAYERWSH